MKRNWLVFVLGTLFVLFGVLWTLQGTDVVGGSSMSGVTVWAVVGPFVVIAGLILLGVGFARRRRISR